MTCPVEMGFMALWREPDLEDPFRSKSHSKDWLVVKFIYFFRSQPPLSPCAAVSVH